MDEVVRHRIHPLPLTTLWRKVLGNIPKDEQWAMMIYGYSQSGKSSLALKIADILAKPETRVLYNAAEERISTGTITLRMQRMRVQNQNIDIYENRSKENLEELISQGDYKYVIIDAVNRIALTQPEILDCFAWQEKYPEISFIYVLHGDKSKTNYIGSSALQNLVDMSFELVNGIINISKNYFSIDGSKETQFNVFDLR